MPSITIDVASTTTPLIDAQLSISFSRLTDVLRVIVEQSNRHESDIDLLKKQLQAERERTAALEAAVQSSSGEQLRSEMTEELTRLRSQVTTLQKQQSETSSKMKENFEVTQKTIADESASTSKAFSSMSERAAQVQNQVNSLRSHVEPRLDAVTDFVELWGADSKRTAALATLTREASKESGAQAEAVEERRAANAEYVRTLKPFAKCVEDGLKAQSNSDQQQPASASAAVDPEAIQSLQDELKLLREQINSLEHRVTVGEQIPPRVTALEERLRLFDATKADVLALQTKADADKTALIAQRVSELRDELAELAARLRAWEEANNQSGRRGSAASTKQVPHPPAVVADDTLRKRVQHLEEAVDGLEQRKADRAELQKLIASLAGGLPPIQQQPVAEAKPHEDPSPRRLGSAPASGKRSVFLGRTVVTVRDANGSVTPASLAARM